MFFIVHYFLICAFHIIFRIVDKTRFELVLLRLQHSTLPLSYLSIKRDVSKIRTLFPRFAVGCIRHVCQHIFCGEYQIRTDEAFTPCCLASSSLNHLSNSPFFAERKRFERLRLLHPDCFQNSSRDQLNSLHFCVSDRIRTYLSLSSIGVTDRYNSPSL